MARRSSYAYRLSRELERQQRLQLQAQRAAVREAERARKAYERAQATEEKERKRLYLEARQADVDAMNAELAGTIDALETLLTQTLDVDDYLDFEALKVEPEPGSSQGPCCSGTRASQLVSGLASMR